MIPGLAPLNGGALETRPHLVDGALDALRLTAGADVAAVTAEQVRDVVARLIAAGQWRDGDPDILIVLDAGYDAPRIAHLLADLPVAIRGDALGPRAASLGPTARREPRGGRPARHGGEFVFGDPATWDAEHTVTTTDTGLHGQAIAQARDRPHPLLTRRAAWAHHTDELPVIASTVTRRTGYRQDKVMTPNEARHLTDRDAN